MVKIQENVSLKPYNTFGVGVYARYFAFIDSEQSLYEAVNWANSKGCPIRVIGGGSNILLTQNIDALVIVMRMQGINLIAEKDSAVIVEVNAGVVWQQLVNWAIKKQLGGIENLSLIPGTVGAAPIQNIGAYGVEFKDVCYAVTVFNRETQKIETLTATQCLFAYRDSVFKHYPERWIVLSVQIKLDRHAPFHINYSALLDQIKKSPDALTYADVSQLICKVRREKLPDPNVLGNAGSFFKNPIVSCEKAEQIKIQYPDVVIFPYLSDSVKLAAAWLIDKAGWRGVREGAVGCYAKQALVIVNYGDATGQAIIQFAEKIQQAVWQRFEVSLELEPVLLT